MVWRLVRWISASERLFLMVLVRWLVSVFITPGVSFIRWFRSFVSMAKQRALCSLSGNFFFVRCHLKVTVPTGTFIFVWKKFSYAAFMIEMQTLYTYICIYIFLLYCPKFCISLLVSCWVSGDIIYFNCRQTFVEVRDPFTQENSPAGQLDVTGLKTVGELVF